MIDLLIRFDKIDGYIRVYDRTRYLVLFGSKKCDYINNRIRYLISVRKGITDVISHNYAKIKVDSYNSVPLEKTMTFHNVVILIKAVFDKDRNNYYYNIFLEKASNELPKNKFLYKIQMLYYDRIDVSEGIDINKTSASKERDIFHYWYLLVMMSINLSL